MDNASPPMPVASAPPLSGPSAQLQHTTAMGPLVLVMWLVSVVAIAAKCLALGFDNVLAEATSPDDAMRLVEVRDFLAGQGWFDLTQYRLEPPAGVFMHWSRLVDLPIATLIRAGEIFLSPADAERFAVCVWPLLLLAVTFAGVAYLARRLAGDSAAVLALGLMPLTPSLWEHFSPGSIDHHNLQITLVVWILALLAGFHLTLSPHPRSGLPDFGAKHVEIGHSRFRLRGEGGGDLSQQAGRGEMRWPWVASALAPALVAGLLAAVSVAVGIEMLPAIAVACLGIAALWIVRGEPVAVPSAAFGVAFATGAAALFAATVPPARYGIAACDALSVVHVVVASIGGLGLAGAALLIRTHFPLHRLLGALAIGAALALTVGIFFRDCLADPEGGLDPLVKSQWLANVVETQSIFSLIRGAPEQVPPLYGFIAAALALSIGAIWRQRKEPQWPWFLAVGVVGTLFGVSLWQARASGGAVLVALPLLAASLVRLFNIGRPRLRGLTSGTLAAALLVNQASLVVLGKIVAHGFELSGQPLPKMVISGPDTCSRAADFRPLASLPKGLVLAAIENGPYVLLATPHAIVAAPYFRNAHSDGMRIALDILLASPAMAKERLMARGVDYVAFCPAAPETRNFAAASPQGLAAGLSRGEVPDFLVRMPPGESRVILFRVMP